ncbi:MAG: U32 family peptidase [Deltaproteobacteria bacterium]|jgi:putative protease|nr:U32 family peptidase [Deltaproteobacteria bacterium]
MRPAAPPKPELLAPAGNMAAWAAAAEAGADAVYAGHTSFSARAYAGNFSLAELAGVIEQSHKNRIKVYIAFNSLIKEGELAQAYQILRSLADLEPDAFIVQDLGLAALARKHCPRIPLHASTLLAAYTRSSLSALARLGFSRAVLPRELSLKEIESLLTAEIMPLEIFIHGAMCFSFSGLCLFSSFLGGRSALRGGCTQPCRRAYQNAGRRGTFFSAADLEAAPYISALKTWPLAAFKIEGRMKDAGQVAKTVKAYRLLLDSSEEDFPENLARARSLLAEVSGRPASGGFLLGPPPPTLPRQGASGLEAGRLVPVDRTSGIVTLTRPLRLLDRLRLVPAPGQEGFSFKLRKMHLGGLPVQEAPAGAEVTIEVLPPAEDRPAAQENSFPDPSASKNWRGAGTPSKDRLGAGTPAKNRQGAGMPSDDRRGTGPPSKNRLGAGTPSNDRRGAGTPSNDRRGAGIPSSAKPASPPDRPASKLKPASGARSPASGRVPGDLPPGPDRFRLTEGLLYLTASGWLEKQYLAGSLARAVQKAQKTFQAKKYPLPAALKPVRAGQPGSRSHYQAQNHLWLWLEDFRDMAEILKTQPERLILPLKADNVRTFGRWKKTFREGPEVVWSLAPLLFSKTWEKTRREVLGLLDRGARCFMAGSLGQAEFLSRQDQKIQIWADYRLGPLNRLTVQSLADLGLSGFTLNLETDEDTWQKLVQTPLPLPVLLYLYGRPALFTSRQIPAGIGRGPLTSLRGEKYRLYSEGDGLTVHSEKAVFSGPLLRRGRVPNHLAGLIADLRLEASPGRQARLVRQAASAGSPLILGSAFNIKRGLT